MQSFRQMDISTREHFDMGTFWLGDFSARGILAEEHFDTGKFPVPKIPHVEMFRCWKVHLPERPQRKTVHVPKCSHDETSMPKWLLPKSQVPKWWETKLKSSYPKVWIVSGAAQLPSKNMFSKSRALHCLQRAKKFLPIMKFWRYRKKVWVVPELSELLLAVIKVQLSHSVNWQPLPIT